MDTSAFVLANEQSLTMHVFDVAAAGVMREICEGAEHGTRISGKEVDGQARSVSNQCSLVVAGRRRAAEQVVCLRPLPGRLEVLPGVLQEDDAPAGPGRPHHTP